MTPKPAHLEDPLFDRTRILVGDAGVDRLSRSHVLVAGLGGVGSFAVEALARAGVGALTLIDHDQVDASNLNRQLVALRSTVGQDKTAVMARRIADINPNCRLRVATEFLAEDGMEQALSEPFDQVIDAIDSLGSKVALIETAWRLGRPILSSMGAGGRMDPTRVQVGDLMETRVCALAREVRTRLRRRGLGRGITVVWSDETPIPPLAPQNTGRGRPRAVNGTLSYMPSIFGLTLAGLAIRRLLEDIPEPSATEWKSRDCLIIHAASGFPS
ncbi:tRNA threonylcarbamoyladenosine dehydratase [Thiorhodococcus mannitoliphagus]|uniref:tRNA threonylcarbamoyladenosine dehydratase n=1 Tax=Thiorhodococcus mannitoliphagus TaxID=329406 RepID=A0A6P1DYK0_9GAMM|nr:tRNA threonylcarbamoyladenosine dehydratase [Thiorhodococcus mannitoliphagus]NEX22759.1 tRNA threonylcarbamoyladenosine dehydratase [Thiorhodococcus mannitoliphagus]